MSKDTDVMISVPSLFMSLSNGHLQVGGGGPTTLLAAFCSQLVGFAAQEWATIRLGQVLGIRRR